MTNKTCCFFGLKNLGNGVRRDTAFWLAKQQIQILIEDGYTDFIFSGEGDFDNSSRMALISAKQKDKHLKQIYYAYPYEDKVILGRKYDEVRILSLAEPDNSSLNRMQIIIDNSNTCVFYIPNSKVISNKAIKYAKEKGKKIINLVDIDS
ncbi:MAG: hypothetical protein FWC80_07245 [Firmicutes bacterium]|nr:hypothetical protein [Bacillota bacterium]